MALYSSPSIVHSSSLPLLWSVVSSPLWVCHLRCLFLVCLSVCLRGRLLSSTLPNSVLFWQALINHGNTPTGWVGPASNKCMQPAGCWLDIGWCGELAEYWLLHTEMPREIVIRSVLCVYYYNEAKIFFTYRILFPATRTRKIRENRYILIGIFTEQYIYSSILVGYLHELCRARQFHIFQK